MPFIRVRFFIIYKSIVLNYVQFRSLHEQKQRVVQTITEMSSVHLFNQRQFIGAFVKVEFNVEFSRS